MKKTITTLSGMLARGEISAAELCEKYVAAIERDNPHLNAYVHLEFEAARAQAKYADKLIKEGKVSPLCGVPMTLKDNICTDGQVTSCCSKILENFKPYYDATVWSKLKACGAVNLGKTNMDEFAMGSASETSCFGAPKNPVDFSRVTGGSSGGGAAAVRANLAAYALGSDTGGSVRQPAAFCGAVGFKPTYGAVSRYGLIAYGSSLDQIGIIANSVSDAALVYDGIRGKDERDMTSCKTPQGKTPLNAEVKGLKIGVAKQFFKGLDKDIEKAVLNAVKIYESAGAEVEEISLPSLEAALPVYYIIACAEASSNLGRYDGIRYGARAEEYTGVEDMIVKTRTQGFGREVKKRIMLGTYVLSSGYFDAYYKKACLLRERISAEIANCFQKYDLLFAPTAPTVAFKAGFSACNPVQTYLSDVCTVPVNICGLPAISIPCGEKQGLPVGLQIIGEKFADAKVLSCAYFAEECGLFEVKDICSGVKL